MRKEFKKIKAVGKKLVDKNHYKKIKKLRNYEDKAEGLKYLIASKLELRFLDLESKIEAIEKKKASFAKSKLILLKSKIKIFKTTHNKKDYEAVERVFKEIEEEIKNV